MSNTVSERRFLQVFLIGRARVSSLPMWCIIIFACAFFFAISPNLLHIYGIHNDYEMLVFKNHGLLFHEAEHNFSIARPVAALLANLPLLPVESIANFRWTRLFSVATACFLGFQMMSICVNRLRVDVLPAVVIALGIFLVPPLIYSVLNAPALVAHLVPLMIAFFAYEVLSSSNVKAIPFLPAVARRDRRGFWRQLWAYCGLRAVWGACLILQIAFYDFPPNALIILVLPVVGVLFSKASVPYRTLIVMRDIGFVMANIAIYGVSVKLIYLPLVRLVSDRSSEVWQHSPLSKFDERMAATYNYNFNIDPEVILGRLKDIVKISGNLWFLPQARLHVVVGIVVMVTLAAVTGGWLWGKQRDRAAFKYGAFALAVPLACFLLAGSAVLVAGGGFVSYRTVPVCIMIAGVVFIFALSTLARPLGATAVALALVATAGAAVAGNFDMNYLTMLLAHNETVYFENIVRRAIETHSTAVIIVDPRPFTLPEDHPVAYDEGGHSVPPYELSCFSGYCLQNGAIVTIIAERLGVPRGGLPVYSIRNGDPIPDANCKMLTSPTIALPAGASQSSIDTINFIRGLGPITCVSYSLAWRNIDVPP